MADREDPDLGGLEAPVDLDDDDLEDLDDEDLVDDDDPLVDDPLVDDPLIDDPLIDDPLVDDPLVAPLVDDALNAAVPLADQTVEGTGEPAAAAVSTTEDGDEDDEEDDDLDPDDVEAGLDVILKDRLVVVDEEPDEDEETPDPEERAEGSTRVPTKRPEEFVCASCFLVKHPSQLADADRMFCRDCV